REISSRPSELRTASLSSTTKRLSAGWLMWQLHGEDRTTTRTVFERQVTTMAFHDGAAQVKSQRAPIGLGGEEGLEELCGCFDGYARPVIGHTQAHRPVVERGLDLDQPLRWWQILHGLQSVEAKVEEHLLEQNGVAGHLRQI